MGTNEDRDQRRFAYAMLEPVTTAAADVIERAAKVLMACQHGEPVDRCQHEPGPAAREGARALAAAGLLASPAAPHAVDEDIVWERDQRAQDCQRVRDALVPLLPDLAEPAKAATLRAGYVAKEAAGEILRLRESSVPGTQQTTLMNGAG
jgi:hypothetical protein